jgi:L-iditol 2-dehydrogenase
VRALKYHGPGQIEVTEVTDPVLTPGGLVVTTAFAGVCGSDVRTWRHGSNRLSGPQVLGHETSGTIVESDVPGLPVGTRVAVCPGIPCLRCERCQSGNIVRCPHRRSLGYDLPGGLAERFAVPQEAVEVGNVVPLPAGLSLRAASIAEPLHTVLNGQERAGVRSGESVLVLGLGPIGTLHVAVARSRGATAMATDLLPERVASAADFLGTAGLFANDGGVDALVEATGRNEWDTVIVAAGSPRAVQMAAEVVAPGGRVLVFGGLPASSAIVGIDLNDLHYRQTSVIGSFGGTPRLFRVAVNWLSTSDLPLERFVTATYPLEAAPDAFAACERGEGLKTSVAVGAFDA